MVWAKMEGYPWWPALICEHPTDKTFTRGNQIHVQFFDDPPTRGWVKEAFVKAYGPASESGIPSYKDPAWTKAVEEAAKVVNMEPSDRAFLLVEMFPSDDEDTMETDESDRSKENVDLNISRKRNDQDKDGDKEPVKKKRRIVLQSDSEPSEDEYKPGNEREHSSEDSASSGVDEGEVSEPEPDTETDVDSPVKATPKRKGGGTPGGSAKRSLGLANRSVNTPSRSPATPARTPTVSANTKSKLALFAAKENTGSSGETSSGEGNWPHLSYQFLKPENIRDKARKRPTDPEYNPRTLHLPDDFLNKQTPALRQWWDLKSRYYDTVLFFKMGKFYEFFHMDAVIGLNELGLLMMKGEVAHSGFPEIAYGRYSATLIDKGYKVARIEQTETPDMMEQRCKKIPRPTKFDKVVKREVCQLTTKGTRTYSVQDGDPTEDACNYLFAITEKVLEGAGDQREFGVTFIDTSIGTFNIGQFVDDRHMSRLRTLVAHHPPAQILYERGRISARTVKVMHSVVPSKLCEALVPEKEFWTANKTLTFLAEGSYFRDKETKKVSWPEALRDMMDDSDSLGLTANDKTEMALRSLGALVWYLMECRLDEKILTQKQFELYMPMDNVGGKLEKDGIPAFIAGNHHMVLDGVTLKNLEVFENSHNGTMEGTLIEQLDKCQTAFGKRLLRSWVCAPLCKPSAINSRLDAISDLQEHPSLVQEVLPMLKKLPDLQRLLSKVHSQGLKLSKDHPDNRAIFFEDHQYSKRKVNDFLTAMSGFKSAIDIIQTFSGVNKSFKSKLLKNILSLTSQDGKFPELEEVLSFFDNAFNQEDAKREGKIIPSSGVDAEYDHASEVIKTTKDRLSDYLKEQCKHFGTKVTYWGNDKKRFQLEVPDHASRRATDEYELQSQKKGFKRYWTSTTKELLADIMEAEDQRNTALKDIARRIFEQFDQHAEKWEAATDCLAVLDVLIAFLQYSQQNQTCCPKIVTPGTDTQPFINIRDGRHPAQILTFSGSDYIPNDVVFGGESEDAHSSLLLVTGPNMGGKSTLMRQTALLCLMAQLGCFVPAEECTLTPIDRVFTRIGASDRITMGESTFFVELSETSSIMKHATKHSLVLVDELGRGTATYDGTAIASSVVGAIVNIGCRTLFSTHYHSLVDDFKDEKGVSLGHMACMVEGEGEKETITFLYKFTSGACPKSYGFNAARLADLPQSIISVGSKKAKELERENLRRRIFREMLQHKKDVGNLRKVFEIVQLLAA
ncbi:DNA mismatch repair protein Msh6 isoform X2 [Oratosquilla oratoria]